MTFLWMIGGCVAGAWLCFQVFDEVGLAGALFGLIVGWLIARGNKLGARVVKLEAALNQLLAPRAASNVSPPVAARSQPSTPETSALLKPAPQNLALSQDERGAAIYADVDSAANVSATSPLLAAPTPMPDAAVRAIDTTATVSSPTVAPGSATAVAGQRPPVRENAALGFAKRWFSEGNVPVKVGVIVLFFGVAYLLKYAADQGWLAVPIEFRFLGVALAALAALVFAWRKRDSQRPFALALQGGAIGMLILIVFAAYRMYALLPSSLAFGLLVVIVAGAGILAVLQDAPALALLAIFGGFLAPILISTGSGNQVALFSYYAVLNAAVFGIAWVKPWRALNLVGFAFTFGIGTFWGVLHYRPEMFATTEPFLLLFFAFYLLLPLLYALRSSPDAGMGQTGRNRSIVDGSLVFGTPLVAFALQATLLRDDHLALAFSAIVAAAIYTALAALELRRLQLKLLGESHALLALGFATIAVPLALSARTTACTFALEGAALVWLGLRQQRRIPRWIGYALQIIAGVALASDVVHRAAMIPLLNGEFLGALLVALAGFGTARMVFVRDAHAPLANLFFAWALLWWLTAGGSQIDRFSPPNLSAAWWLGFFSLTGFAAGELHRRLHWPQCLVPAFAALALGLPFIALTSMHGHGPLEGWAVAAWALWLVATAATLRALAGYRQRPAAIAHLLAWWIGALLVSAELAHAAYRYLELSQIWIALAACAPFVALFLLVQRRNALARWPLDDTAESLRTPLLASLGALLACMWLVGLCNEGRPYPLPYLPIVNPLELAQIGLLVLFASWYRQFEQERHAPPLTAEIRARAIALAGLVLLTSITLRSVHFLGGVPWNDALFDSPLAQAALSVVWTLAGIAAMLIGKRRGSRAVWFGGAALMAVVLVKLFLVDRQYLHDLPAIIGVLVVGVLLVTVGYFAPVPPRHAAISDTP